MNGNMIHPPIFFEKKRVDQFQLDTLKIVGDPINDQDKLRKFYIFVVFVCYKKFNIFVKLLKNTPLHF